MKRLLVNGSPRGAESNSRLLLQWLAEGMAEAGAPAAPVADLARRKEWPEIRAAWAEADEVVLAFPLYCDSLPAVAMAFLEGLVAERGDRLRGKRLACVVQSGFPERVHAEAVGAWLERLAIRLGMVNAGVALRGGVEGVRAMPERMSAKLRAGVRGLGRSLAADGRFDPALVERLGAPRRLNWVGRQAVRLLGATGLINAYWNMKLKENGAYRERFDRPYA